MLQVDGLDAYELEADAIDVRSGAPMRLYQIILPDETGYFIGQGLSPARPCRRPVPRVQSRDRKFSQGYLSIGKAARAGVPLFRRSHTE